MCERLTPADPTFRLRGRGADHHRRRAAGAQRRRREPRRLALLGRMGANVHANEGERPSASCVSPGPGVGTCRSPLSALPTARLTDRRQLSGARRALGGRVPQHQVCKRGGRRGRGGARFSSMCRVLSYFALLGVLFSVHPSSARSPRRTGAGGNMGPTHFRSPFVRFTPGRRPTSLVARLPPWNRTWQRLSRWNQCRPLCLSRRAGATRR